MVGRTSREADGHGRTTFFFSHLKEKKKVAFASPSWYGLYMSSQIYIYFLSWACSARYLGTDKCKSACVKSPRMRGVLSSVRHAFFMGSGGIGFLEESYGNFTVRKLPVLRDESYG